jgi:hypothetical protein
MFFDGITRLFFTSSFSAIVLGWTKGSEYWIQAALAGCIYQVIVELLQWPDSTGMLQKYCELLGLTVVLL